MASIDLKNPAIQKLLLGSVCGIAMLAVFFFTHFLPFGYPRTQEHVNALKSEYEKKSTDLARARTTVADLPRFEAEYAQLHEQWVLAAELLPTDKDLPALLRKISLSGEQTGIQFQMFRPMAPRSEQYFTETPVAISVIGSYHQVGSFLAELANMRRIVTVSNVRLRANTSTDPNQSTAAELTASAYNLNTNPVPTAPAAAPKKAPNPDGHQEE